GIVRLRRRDADFAGTEQRVEPGFLTLVRIGHAAARFDQRAEDSGIDHAKQDADRSRRDVEDHVVRELAPLQDARRQSYMLVPAARIAADEAAIERRAGKLAHRLHDMPLGWRYDERLD